MINDPSINVYEVVAEAESYFQNIDKNAKGSGWKAYNRWLYENEPKFYPKLAIEGLKQFRNNQFEEM